MLPSLPAHADSLRAAIAVDLHRSLSAYEIPAALAKVVGALEDNDYIGVWALARGERQLQPIASAQGRSRMAKRLVALPRTRKARDLVATIDVMMNHITLTYVESGLGGNRVLIVMGGGEYALTRSNLNDVIAVLKSTDVHVHAVALGPSISATMKEMVTSSSGRLYHAATPGALDSAVSALLDIFDGSERISRSKEPVTVRKRRVAPIMSPRPQRSSPPTPWGR